MWERNDSISLLDKGTVICGYTGSCTTFYDFTSNGIYITHDVLAYAKELIDTYGLEETLERLELLLESEEIGYIGYGIVVVVALVAIVEAGEVAVAAAAAGTAFLTMTDISVLYDKILALIKTFMLFMVQVSIYEIIEYIYDEQWIGVEIDSAYVNDSGLYLEYSASGALPNYTLSISEWNPGEGVARVLPSNEFGNLDFFDVEYLCDGYPLVINPVCDIY